MYGSRSSIKFRMVARLVYVPLAGGKVSEAAMVLLKPAYLVICPIGVSHHCSHFRQLRNFRQYLNNHISYSIMPCLNVACAGRWLKTCFSTYLNEGEFSCLSVRLSGLFRIWPSAPLLSHLFVDSQPYCLIRWLNKF